MNTNTAILIFANSAKTEGLNKPFKQSAVLFDALNTAVEAKVKRTKLPYFVVSEKEQIGNNFGERFTNAIQSVFDKGFENIITVGNDTPHLKTAHITKTIEKLNQKTLVLGPSKDGGFYLMGINKALFNATQFLQLPWQTSVLNQTIFKFLSLKKIAVELLETLQDIDTVSDVSFVLNSFKSLSALIKNILLGISTSAKAILLFILNFFFPIYKSKNYNKGSPQLFSIKN